MTDDWQPEHRGEPRPRRRERPAGRPIPWPLIGGIVLLAILTVVLAILVMGGGTEPVASNEPSPSAGASDESAVPSASAAVPTVQPSTRASAAPGQPSLAGRVLVADADGLRLRSAPTENGDILATLRAGLRMAATGGVEGDWFEVRLGPESLTGWVSAGPDRSWLRLVADGAIAFASSAESEGGAEAWVLATPFGDPEHVQVAGGEVMEVAWSPDGSRLAMTVAGDDGTAVDVADANGSNRRTIGPGGYGPSWSPDGRLAWSSMAGIVVTDESLTPAILDVELRNPGRPFWSPDSTRMVLVAMDCPECPEGEPIMGDVAGAVYVVDLSTGTTTKLTDPGYYGLGGWSPDGSRITYTTIDLSGERPQQAFSVAADGGPPMPILDGAAVHQAPMWSPDGSRMALGTPDGLVVMTGDGSSPSVLVPTGALLSVGQWSPSGEWLVFQTGDGPNLGLWIVRADGGEAPRRISATEVAAGMPSWQPLTQPLP